MMTISANPRDKLDEAHYPGNSQETEDLKDANDSGIVRIVFPEILGCALLPMGKKLYLKH